MVPFDVAGVRGRVGAARPQVHGAADDWLMFGLAGRSAATVAKYRHLCEVHVVPQLGARKLRQLTTTEVDRWLLALAGTLSHRTLVEVRSCLNRAVRRAVARDLVRRNVVELSETPRGQAGRRSKALTAEQADAVLGSTAEDRLHAYIVVSLLTGARTEGCARWDGSTCTSTGGPVCRRTWRCGGRCGQAATQRPGDRVERWRCLLGVWWRCGVSERSRRRTGWRPARLGWRRAWCSRRGLGLRWTRRTFGGISGVLLGWCRGSMRRIGRPGSCATPSCRCCRTVGCRWRRYRGSWVTRGRR